MSKLVDRAILETDKGLETVLFSEPLTVAEIWAKFAHIGPCRVVWQFANGAVRITA